MYNCQFFFCSCFSSPSLLFLFFLEIIPAQNVEGSENWSAAHWITLYLDNKLLRLIKQQKTSIFFQNLNDIRAIYPNWFYIFLQIFTYKHSGIIFQFCFYQDFLKLKISLTWYFEFFGDYLQYCSCLEYFLITLRNWCEKNW